MTSKKAWSWPTTWNCQAGEIVAGLARGGGGGGGGGAALKLHLLRQGQFPQGKNWVNSGKRILLTFGNSSKGPGKEREYGSQRVTSGGPFTSEREILDGGGKYREMTFMGESENGAWEVLSLNKGL